MSDQIDVNQLSNALQQKVDLPSGKSQADIDYVVEWQAPDPNNYNNWYRLYKSGWVEQGGRLTTNTSSQTVTLPITMADTNYSLMLSIGNSINGTGTTGYTETHGYGILTTSTIYVDKRAGSNIDGIWEVKGFAAQN